MDWRKSCIIIKNMLEVNKLDGCSSNSFLTFLICLQCSDKILGRRSRDVLYDPGHKTDLTWAILKSYLSCIPRVIKIVLSAKICSLLV